MKRNTTLIALGTMVALAAVGTASAATTTAAQPAATQATCDALVKQADSALTAHKADPKAKSAQEQRDKGEKECKAGNFAKGAEHLRRAITDLGMKPVN
jgi:ABC-type transporter MlaC component